MGQRGKNPSRSSSFLWDKKDYIWLNGPSREQNMHFAKTGNTHACFQFNRVQTRAQHADYVQVFPKTNIAYTWCNQCDVSGSYQGEGCPDDGAISDPSLPSAPGDTEPSDPDPTGPPSILDPVCASTISSTAYLASPTPEPDSRLIEGNLYFAVFGSCYRDTSVVDHNQG